MDLPTTHYEQTDKEPKMTETKAPATQPRKGLLTRISSYIFLFCVFLAPLIFIPSLYAPLDVVKTAFITFCILISALLYAIDALKNKTFVLPRFALGYVSIALVVSIFISSLMSSNISKSFMGLGFEIGTASFFFLMFLAAFLVSRMVIKDREIVFKIYSAFFLSFIVLALLQLARLFGGAGFLSLGILSNVASSIAGKWYDFGILTAVMGLLSFIGIKFLPLRGGLKRVLMATLVVCAFLLFVINSSFIWGVFALVVLAVLIYEYTTVLPKGTGMKGLASKGMIFSIIVFVIAGGLAWKGNTFALPLIQSLKAEYGEAILPWQLTLDVTTNTLKTSPLFGAGPNRFIYQYLLFKPLEINATPFWNSEFTSGIGYLPTTAATTGIIGALLWIAFLIIFLRDGFRALRRINDPLKRFFVTSSFFAALFLWIIDIIYVPSHVVILLTFIFTGIFAALLISEGILTERHLGNKEGKKSGRLASIVYSICVIVLIVWLGAYTKKAIALTYFEKGIKELNVAKSPEAAQEKFKKALQWDNSDVYYQALSEINILKINGLTQELQAAAASNPNAPADQKKVDQVVALITDSVKYTKAAEQIDPNNYYNYLAEARISELGASLKLPNAYENAKNAYGNAARVNPYNPAIFLNLARLEASQNHLADADQFVGHALQLKNNYTEAVFFLSQLQVANNQIAEAIISTKFAIGLTPNEPLLYFQLGLLEYNNKNYSDAAAALEKAVTINPQYANARYFLGLSYARLGKNAEAIAQFDELTKTNADNKEVAFILDNLKNGKSPFADAQPPIDSKPEKRKTLPVTEKSTKKTIN